MKRDTLGTGRNHLIAQRKIIVWAAAVFLFLAGCQKLPSLKPTPTPTPMVERKLSVGGMDRSYLLYIPAKARAAASVPVVLVLHNSGSTPEAIAKITGFNGKADAEGFVVVYPRGTPSQQVTDKFWWNSGLCCGLAQKNKVDDVAFIRALLADLATVVPVDGRRIFAAGLYTGALMSYRLGCEMADRIAAVGAVAGTQNVETCRPAQPVSIIDIHGTADAVVPYAGGVGTSMKNFSFASVKDTIDFWITADQCPGTVVREESGPVVHEAYSPCSDGAAVELYTIQDGAHVWPGGTQTGTRVAKSPSTINATNIIWDFFLNHPKPEHAS
jgi:polyhydroxybutyrate depolymerase